MTAVDTLNAIYSTGQTLVFGHRGAKAYAPMNTIPAFELAAEQGAHGIELDVHLTHDGALVIVHDDTVDDTSNGSGRVVDMSLDELKSLDAGSWFDPKFAGVQIPTLDEVFAAVGQSLYINVEIKGHQYDGSIVEQAVATCIEKNNMQSRVIVSSFDPNILRRFRDISPAIPVGYLEDNKTMLGPTQAILDLDSYDAFHWYHTMVDEKHMEYAKECGKYVNVWTVNDPARARQLHLLGVHGIITDNPDTILRALSG